MPAAALCGRKRNSYYFSDQNNFAPSSSSKKLRCSTSASASPSGFHHLKSLFPHTPPQLLEKALEECGNDLDYAIKSLHEHEHCLEPAEHYSRSDQEVEQVTLTDDGDAAASWSEPPPSNFPADGAEWVDLLVREMMSATSVDDARARASRILEVLEKSISARAAEESAESCQKENMLMKEKIQVLIRENTILKKAVAIQHERQKEFDDKNRELQQLKQLVSQYQEQLRTLEVHNYALMMHLRQAQQSSHIPGHFPPDVF